MYMYMYMYTLLHGWIGIPVNCIWDHAKAVHDNVLLNANASKYIFVNPWLHATSKYKITEQLCALSLVDRCV